ncbi:Bug family tripartite tricarboxylate transporter substrate binding protein [Microbispora sp. NPDC049125]|uniref:Bug family tripartite tricarboxylate transporter substrate binding protein n=1 Tax=Microbispora sp. NPDC049125 TaxID=3154929 RepID=UPI00346779BC
MRRRTVLALGVLALAGGCGTQAPPYQSAISLVVPGAGRGDVVARELKALIEARRWARAVRIRRSRGGGSGGEPESDETDGEPGRDPGRDAGRDPGGGFERRRSGGSAVGSRPADAPSAELMVADPALLAQAAMGRGPLPATRTAPLVRLAGEWEVLVAAPGSGVGTFERFARDLVRDPGGRKVAGGAVGGPEHQAFGLTAVGLGADPRLIDYAAFEDGAQAVDALLDGRVAAGFAGQRDVVPHIRAGRLRPLVVSSPERLPGVDAPTLLESGVGVVFANWWGLLTPLAQAAGGRERLLDLCRAIGGSPLWERVCARNGWTPLYLEGDDFRQWLAAEARRTTRLLADLGLR